MFFHPANRILRFVLEIVSVVILAQWAMQLTDSPLRFLWMALAPLLVALLWLLFASNDDPAFSLMTDPKWKFRRLHIPGGARLTFELACFGFVDWCLLTSGQTVFAIAYGFVVALHFIWSLDRVFVMLGLVEMKK